MMMMMMISNVKMTLNNYNKLCNRLYVTYLKIVNCVTEYVTSI